MRLRGWVWTAAAAAAGIGSVLTGCVPMPAAGNTVEGVPVVAARPDVAGYDRSCKAGHRCVFGQAWSDTVGVAGGRNGCDTRNDMLRRDLQSVQLKPGTQGCVVLSGTLTDPYSGVTVSYEKGGRQQLVEIDHTIPLAAAWDLGAHQWSQQKRTDFANDPRNLQATSRTTNRAKSDKTPGHWMPTRNQCRFARNYLAVARAYDLPVTRRDARTLTDALSSCDSEE